MMIRFITLSCCLLLSLLSQAQKGSIKGSLIDSTSKSPLGLATITVFEAEDTTLITYRLSTPDGSFTVPGIPLNTLARMIISFSGYEVIRKNFTLENTEPLDFDTIPMITASESLEEIMVIAERPPVTVRKDTIEFNANSFKTLPTALVEDLLRKLPGVEVDGDGNITVNGKAVNRIMVDGKDFFGTDPKMATRNLPANVIDKIQVTEDKDQKAMNPDMPESEIGQVINLKFKKGVKQGWFGKAYAGGGTDDRYETGGIVNMFRDTAQVSILGFANNLNKPGFGIQDVMSLGGFNRSRTQSISINSGGGFELNGVGFGGMGNGVTRSTGGGINLNHVLKSGLTLNTQYFYGQNKEDIRQFTNQQQFTGDTITTTRTNRNELRLSNNHRIGLSIRGNIDSLTRLDFRPSLVFTDQNSTGNSTSDIMNNKQGALNNSRNDEISDDRSINYQHDASIFKTFKKKGRTLNISNNISISDNNTDQQNIAENEFFTDPMGVTLLDQQRNRLTKNTRIWLNANYNDPLSKKWSLRLGYGGEYLNSKDDLQTFTKDNEGKYEVPDPALSNLLDRNSWKNDLNAGLNFKHKKLTVTGTASFLMLNIKNNFGSTIPEINQGFQYLLPRLVVNWNGIQFNYNVNVNPPNITDLQPVPNNTNPLYIIEGNPSLLPEKSHSLGLNYFKFDPSTQLMLNVFANGSFTENAVVRSRVLLPNGVQVSTPVNADGNRVLYGNTSLGKQFRFSQKFSLNLRGGFNTNYARRLVLINNINSFSNTLDIGPNLNVRANWQDIIEWSVEGRTTRNKTTYENNAFDDIALNRHSGRTELIVRWPKHVVWDGSLNYFNNPNPAPGIRTDNYLVNTGVTFLFLKEDKGQLKFSVNDLLNQNISVYRYTRENMITDQQTNNIQRYFMLTFTYNIRDFKGGKVGGQRSMFFF